MDLRRICVITGTFISPVVVWIVLQTFFGMTWLSVHGTIAGVDCHGTSLNIKGGLISSLSISLKELNVEGSTETKESYIHSMLYSAVSSWNPFSKIKIHVDALNFEGHRVSQAKATLTFDRQYDFINMTALSFQQYENADWDITIDRFSQSHCMQCDLQNHKLFFSFLDDTTIRMGPDRKDFKINAEGSVSADDFVCQGECSLQEGSLMESLSYEWSAGALALSGAEDNYGIGAWIGDEFECVGTWSFSDRTDFHPQWPVTLQISRVLYHLKDKTMKVDYRLNHKNDDCIQGSLIYDAQLQTMQADLTDMQLLHLGHFKGTGLIAYNKGLIQGTLTGAMDDIAVPRRTVSIIFQDDRGMMTHPDVSDVYGDWNKIEWYRDEKTQAWHSLIEGAFGDLNWNIQYDFGTQRYQGRIGDLLDCPITAIGHLDWTDHFVKIDQMQFFKNAVSFMPYAWTLHYDLQSSQIDIEGLPLHSESAIAIAIQPCKTGLEAVDSWHCAITSEPLTATIDKSAGALDILAKTIQIDTLWSWLYPIYQTVQGAHSGASSEETPVFFNYPIAMHLKAERVIWSDKIFHKVSLNHHYKAEAIEHRWNMSYREGSACIREYFDHNMWKHEATFLLSSGKTWDPSLKGGAWALSLYHDRDYHPHTVWHLCVADLFVENWQSDLYTSLNILSGSAFMPRQTRSLMEDGLVVEKIIGRGIIIQDVVHVESLEMHAGAVSIQGVGHYSPLVDNIQLDLIVRPKLSQAISSVATLFSPWSAGVAWIGFKSFGKEVDTWNEQMYHLRGSSEKWDIIPWEPEVLSLSLSES